MENNKHTGRWIGVFSIVAIVIAVVALVLVGYLSVIWKQPQQKVLVVNRVCTADIVARYNKVTENKSDGDDLIIDETGLKNLVSEIESNKDFQSDPTCQTIMLATAIHQKNYNAAKTAYAALKDLYNKHLYVDSNLNGTFTISAYSTFIQELAPNNNNGSTGEPQGGA